MSGVSQIFHCSDRAGQADWSERVIGGATSGIDHFISDIEKFVRQVGGKLIQAGLDALLWIVGIDPKEFWDTLNNFLEGGFTAAKSLVDSPSKFVKAVADGTVDAFKRYLKGFPENFLGDLWDWLV